MTDENLNDRTPSGSPADESVAAHSGDTSPEKGSEASPEATPQTTTTEAPPQYGVGPFSIREVVLAGVWLVAFVVSFFPLNLLIGPERVLIGGVNVWVSGLSWILTIGVPTVAVFLIVLRRLSPQGIPRVGSLGIDQFASVAFSVSAIVWLQAVWETVAVSMSNGVWVRSWVIWVELILMLAGVVLTVLAPFIPGLEQDFQDRREVPAHRNARPIRPVVVRPKVERPAPSPSYPAAGAAGTSGAAGGEYAPETYDSGVVRDPAAASVHHTGAYDTGAYGTAVSEPAPFDDARQNAAAQAESNADTGTYGTDVFAPLTEPDPQPSDEWAPAKEESVQTTQLQTPAQQAFWALVPVERDVVDDYGTPLFRIGPTAWALVIEDRGEAFVVRHEDGRIGYLHDVSGVTRG